MTDSRDRRTPPYRIEVDGLVLRCWQPNDAALLKDAVDSSLEHLRAWMPWAKDEPQTLEQKRELIRTFRGNFDLDKDYTYGIFDADETRALGSCGLHLRSGPRGVEIGYWVRADSLRQRVATRVTHALTKVAFELSKVERIDILIAPENAASAAIPRKLGFAEATPLRRHIEAGADEPMQDALFFNMTDDEYAASALGELELNAFDAVGEPILPG